MGLKELSQIDIKDLKNINLGQFQESVREKPHMLAVVIGVLVTLGLLGYSVVYHQNTKKALDYELVEKREKLELLEQYQQVKNDYDALIGALPKSIDRDTAVKEISRYAADNDVEIASISVVNTPASVDENGKRKVLQPIKIELNVSAKNYPDLLSFIKEVENSTYMIRIERWTGKLKSVARNEKTEQINFVMGIVALEVDEERSNAQIQ